MYQLFAVVISFSVIPILIKKKMKLSYTLLITAGILGVFSNLGIKNIFKSVLDVFLNAASRSTVLTVMMVTVLGGLMGHYNVLEKIVQTLGDIIKSKKNILMIIPAFIGLLIMPGGALLSAPFVNNLGKEVEIPSERRAAINLVFRHIAMFIVPYATGILIVLSSFPEINIMKIIALNFIFISLLILVGYFLFVRDIKIKNVSKRKDLPKNMMKLVILTSPIYIPVILNLMTGMAFHITLIPSIVVVYFLGDKKDFIKNFIKSISWHTVLNVVSILIIKEIILRMDGLLALFNSMFNSSEHIIYTLCIFLITSIFFGFITGTQSAALAVTLPILAQLKVGNNLLYIYIYFTFAASFMGYFFSPIHLCQTFTIETMGTKIGDLYKEYKWYSIFMFLIIIGTVFIFNMTLV